MPSAGSNSGCCQRFKEQKRTQRERWGKVMWGMQGASGTVSALSEALKLVIASLQAPGPSREAQGTPAASSEAPAGQREASSHPMCTLEKT